MVTYPWAGTSGKVQVARAYFLTLGEETANRCSELIVVQLIEGREVGEPFDITLGVFARDSRNRRKLKAILRIFNGGLDGTFEKGRVGHPAGVGQ